MSEVALFPTWLTVVLFSSELYDANELQIDTHYSK